MKKQLLISLCLILPSVSFAKVDFGSLIKENTQAQKELHQGLRDNLKEARQETTKRERIVVVESKGTSYNAPTNSNLLKFEKEKSYHNHTEDLDRIATEMSGAE